MLPEKGTLSGVGNLGKTSEDLAADKRRAKGRILQSETWGFVRDSKLAKSNVWQGQVWGFAKRREPARLRLPKE